MSSKLYVGNLSYDSTETEIEDAFAQAGTVKEVVLVQDRFTGKSRGFAFVTMASQEEAEKAIQQLNGSNIGGRSITVNEARPREERAPGGGGGGGGGGRSFGNRGGGGGGGGGGYGGGGGGGRREGGGRRR